MFARLLQKAFSRLRGRPLPPSLAALSRSERRLIRQIRAHRLTYLSEAKLASLAQAVRMLEKEAITGQIVEAGCALGGSAILMARCKQPARPLKVYDVFGMIPPPGDNDTEDVHQRYAEIRSGASEGIGGDAYYGYETDLLQKVSANFERFRVDLTKQQVALVQGLVQDTLHPAEPVALAHIDVDWYEPVLTCLERIHPHLVSGGVIILDDYFDWGGCRKATDDFLKEVGETYDLDDRYESLRLTKRA